MAQKGFSVTAFDITKEMIDEGEKRFRSVENLSLNIADICNLHLSESDIIGSQDGEKGFSVPFFASERGWWFIVGISPAFF